MIATQNRLMSHDGKHSRRHDANLNFEVVAKGKPIPGSDSQYPVVIVTSRSILCLMIIFTVK